MARSAYRVRLTADAEDDLLRLYDCLLESDFNAAEHALEAIRSAFALLEVTPWSCRKAAADSPFVRELIVPFGSAGYVALFEIEPRNVITVPAVRHQREDDYQ